VTLATDTEQRTARPKRAAPNRKNITQRFADTVTPPASGYTVWWDTNLPAFGLRVSSRAIERRKTSHSECRCPSVGKGNERSAWSKDPGMRARLSPGNRGVSGSPTASRATGRTVKAGGRRP
jgi:hypothetical protein